MCSDIFGSNRGDSRLCWTWFDLCSHVYQWQTLVAASYYSHDSSCVVIPSSGTGFTWMTGDGLNFCLWDVCYFVTSVYLHVVGPVCLPAGPVVQHTQHYLLSCLCFSILSFCSMWVQEGCEPGLKEDEEGSNLLSRFPGFKTCCIVLCGDSGGGFCLRRWRLLLPVRSPLEPWGWSWVLWLIFELAPWICGLLGEREDT